MTGRACAGIVAAIVAILLGCAGTLSAVLYGGTDATTIGCTTPLGPSATAATGAATASTTVRWPQIGRWNPTQVSNAAIIIATGARRGIPSRGWIIAVATAMTESTLHNYGNRGAGNDHDSLGLFQQRPSQGWGTPAQIMDPAHAATAFYDHLTDVTHWQTLPLTEAAQAVQRSAHPDAYASWEIPAEDLLTAIGTTIAAAACPGGATVLARAETWLTGWHGGPVPYRSSSNPHTWFRGYRRDCSGYASMALGLPGPGLNTAGLAAHSTAISKADLHPGDLLINPAPNGAGHVVIFDHWADAALTRYVGYEQSGDGGTHHRTIPYPYFGTYQMSPYRYTTTDDHRPAERSDADARQQAKEPR